MGRLLRARNPKPCVCGIGARLQQVGPVAPSNALSLGFRVYLLVLSRKQGNMLYRDICPYSVLRTGKFRVKG